MAAKNIIDRAKSILLTPRSEWPLVAEEPDTVGGLYTKYIVIMAAIPVVVHFISASLIGVSVPILGYYRVGVPAALSRAIISYVVALVGIFIAALVVNALAPTFGGQKNQVQALKTFAYACTASWVASIVGLVPGLTLIAALAGGIYGIYLLNMGLPFTMKCPPEKSVGYTAVTIIVTIIIVIVLNLIVVSATGWGIGHTRIPGDFSAAGSGDNGGFARGSAGAGLQAWSNKMAAASQQVDAAQKSGDANAKANAVGAMLGAALGSGGKVESLAPDRIKPFVPDSLAGLKRTEMSADRSAAVGVQVSKAEATYSDGTDHRLKLEITDTGSLKGLVGFAGGWAGVEQDHETDNGYDKTYKSNGQLVHEKWDNQSHNGEYGVIVGDRFSVNVSGKAASIDELKAAVASINLSGLAALKNEGVQSN
jgi:hypothetical protein